MLLTNAQLQEIATRFTWEYRAGNPARWERDISGPPGAYFFPDYLDDAFGDAGFFVSRIDGRVIALGTGAFPPEALGPGPVHEAYLCALLTRYMLEPAPPPDIHGLRVRPGGH